MKNRFTYDYVKNYIEYYGYKLVSKEYKNANEKLDLICNKGHVYKTNFNKFKYSERRCPNCYNELRGKSQKHSYNYIKDFVEKYNYVLLSDKYKNTKSKIKLQCPMGHTYEVIFSSFKKGHRCPHCYHEKNGESQRIKINDIKREIDKRGYKLLNKNYSNLTSKTKLQLECPNNHIFKMQWNNFQQGQKCPICNSKNYSSIAEKEIQQFVSTIYNGEIKPNDRNTIINPLTEYNLELDIYLPEINKAIEFNGAYWHSLPKATFYDKIKKDQCEKLGINLLVIDESNWLKDKNTCLKNIKYFLAKKE